MRSDWNGKRSPRRVEEEERIGHRREDPRRRKRTLAALKAEHETLARLRAEAETLRGDIKKAHEERDASFQQVVTLTDQLNSAVNERTKLAESASCSWPPMTPRPRKPCNGPRSTIRATTEPSSRRRAADGRRPGGPGTEPGRDFHRLRRRYPQGPQAGSHAGGRRLRGPHRGRSRPPPIGPVCRVIPECSAAPCSEVIVSTTNSTDKPSVYRPAGPDVYTVLLVIALLAIIVSCVFLYLYMADYGFKIKGGPVAAVAPAAERAGGGHA